MRARRNPAAWRKRGISLPSLTEVLSEHLTKGDKAAFQGEIVKRLTEAEYADEDNRPKAFVQFSNLNKLGLNPRTIYNTPLGIYAYPLSFDIMEQIAKGSLPFAQDRKYAILFRAAERPKPTAPKTILYTSQDLGWYDLEDYVKRFWTTWHPDDPNYPYNEAERHALVSSKIGELWYLTRQATLDTDGTTRPVKWMSLFRDLDIAAIVDDAGTTVIHRSEPAQAVFFGLDTVDMIGVYPNTLTPTAVAMRRVQASLKGDRLIEQEHLVGTSFKRRNLQGLVIAEGTNLDKADFQGSDLQRGHFVDSYFRGAMFDNANLREAEIRSSDMSGAVFTGANLNFAKFVGVKLAEADFTGASLYGAEIHGNQAAAPWARDIDNACVFRNANMHGISLRNLDMMQIDCVEANLTDANLTGCTFAGGDFDDADLRGSTWKQCNVDGVSFFGADLRNAHFVQIHHLNEARFNVRDWNKGKLEGAMYTDADGETIPLIVHLSAPHWSRRDW